MANERIEIQTPSYTNTNMGGQTVTWNTDSTVWAYMTSKTVTSRETYAQDVLQSKTVHHFIIRYNSSYANTKDFASNRIKIGDRIFNVQNIVNLDENAKDEAGKFFQRIMAIENQPEQE